MNKSWICYSLGLSCFLLMVLKSFEVDHLKPYMRGPRTIKLERFTKAKQTLSLRDQDLLELWESMLTGRSAPLARFIKEQYELLNLKHLFTPSGFHLSAVLGPLLWLLPKKKLQLFLLSGIGLLLFFFVPGQGALKRMVLIKGNQKLWGMKAGFIIGLLLDVLFGSFQEGALSFTFSFLFLSLIYSGLKGVGLIFWFFVAQMILSYFNGNLISPLLLVLSPLLNFAFGLAMPFLFVLSFPLWEWQLSIGLFLLRLLQELVALSATIVTLIPSWEVSLMTLFLTLLFSVRNWRGLAIGLLFLSSSLNLDFAIVPSPSTYEFVPQGEVVKLVSRVEDDVIYFTDGKCKRRLVRGMWWESCVPKKRPLTRRGLG